MPAFYKTLTYKGLLVLKKMIVGGAQPRPVLFAGDNALEQLCEAVAQYGVKNVLIVTDKPLVELGLVGRVEDALAQHNVALTVYDEVLPDPTVSVVNNGLARLREGQCEAVLGFGGGSSLDAAKVIALAGANGFGAQDCVGLNKGKRAPLPLFAVPTTAGTGSECTIAAVVSDDISHEKQIVANRSIVPLMAALDASVMQGLPPHITAATGMDALTHAVESYINTWSTDETLALGRAATKMIFENLERACQQGDDMAARRAMALASYYAGLAFTSSLVGYVHAIAHQLGAHYGIPHGLANAMVLPHVLELFKHDASKALAELAVHCDMGEPGMSEQALVERFIDRVRVLNEAVGIPSTTDKIQRQDIAAIVDAAMKEGSGYPVPRFIERHECESVVRKLMA